MAAVAVEERVGAMASHSGRVPILNNPWASSNTAAWESSTKMVLRGAGGAGHHKI